VKRSRFETSSFAVAAALCAGVALTSCGDSLSVPAGVADAGLVEGRLALTLPAGSNLTVVSYAVVSGTGDVITTGTIYAGAPDGTLSAVLALPPGTGVVLELTGTTAAGEPCTGTSAPFNLVEDQALSIEVTLFCGGDTQSG
jgi:hypothetical protein